MIIITIVESNGVLRTRFDFPLCVWNVNPGRTAAPKLMGYCVSIPTGLRGARIFLN